MPKDIFYFSKPDRVATMVLLAIIFTTAVLRLLKLGENHLTEESEVVDSIRVASSHVQLDTVAAILTDTVQEYTTSYQRKEKKERQYRYASSGIDRKVTTNVLPDSSGLEVKRESGSGYYRKRRPESPLDINIADSASLVKLPGIGPWFASRIVEYRAKLGGYFSVDQLSEIDGLPDSVMQWFVVTDTVKFNKIPVNRSSLSELRRHPYINFYQARAIVELRQQYGTIKGPERLSLLEEFTGQDLERLKPYLGFE